MNLTHFHVIFPLQSKKKSNVKNKYKVNKNDKKNYYVALHES